VDRPASIARLPISERKRRSKRKRRIGKRIRSTSKRKMHGVAVLGS
jgi:hypothetical protein